MQEARLALMLMETKVLQHYQITTTDDCLLCNRLIYRLIRSLTCTSSLRRKNFKSSNVLALLMP